MPAQLGLGGQLTLEDEWILVSVSDTGMGFAQQLAEQIFDPFFTTKPQGTGMGLRISRSIIESHGGRLWAVGSPGRGAIFHLSLPAAPKVPQNPTRDNIEVQVVNPDRQAARGGHSKNRTNERRGLL